MSLPFHPKGTYKTKAGHLRFHAPRSLRGKYVHRHVVEQCIAETPYSIRLLLPWPYEVHHMDYNKIHNCGANLLMCSESFHSSMTNDSRRRDNFRPKWQPPPDWVLFDDSDSTDEVPF